MEELRSTSRTLAATLADLIHPVEPFPVIYLAHHPHDGGLLTIHSPALPLSPIVEDCVFMLPIFPGTEVEENTPALGPRSTALVCGKRGQV